MFCAKNPVYFALISEKNGRLFCSVLSLLSVKKGKFFAIRVRKTTVRVEIKTNVKKFDNIFPKDTPFERGLLRERRKSVKLNGKSENAKIFREKYNFREVRKLKSKTAKQFLPCEVELVTIKSEDVITTSAGIDVGKAVDGDPYKGWGGIGE